ncbi:EamA family transporter [Sporolactobacillus sp. CPB3-1]|uniref:EamA family transporter n=1 Tax=Sporolactobacillus mangiferae TaxID=2940498 RepID=A0ABT0MB47_9BACL|nr:EamA family transporter [Sporolactobacillus mangiferae]MCL1632096.1 EamA family transporter [Sporolactobacillus mangiferae]
MSLKSFFLLNILGALWGGSFLFMRVAAPVLGPFLLIDARVLIAGLALLIYAYAIRRLPDFKGKWKQYLVLGAVNAAIPFTLIATAELHVTASVSSILNATTPLFTLLAAAVWLKEKLRPGKILSMFLGIAGVAVLAGWGHLGHSPIVLLSILFSLLASLCYGIGGVYTKLRFASENALVLAIGQQLAAGVVLIPFSLPTVGRIQMLTAPVLISVLCLAVFSTSIGYLIYFYLIRHEGPTRTLSVTLLVPLYGVFWGVLLLGEQLSIGTVAGLILILTSTMLITETRPRFGMRRPLAADSVTRDSE